MPWQDASCLKPAPGVVYVEMAPYVEKRGELCLPEQVQQMDRADCGIVLACGFERGNASPPKEMEIRPGEMALVEPCRGTWLKDAQFGPYKAKGWVRVYGLSSGNWDEHHPYHWSEAILAVIDDYHTEQKTIRAVGNWLVVKKDKYEESKGGVLLTWQSQRHPGMGTIISAGQKAQKTGYEAGQRIQFPPGLTFDAGYYEMSHAKEFGLDSEDYCILLADNVLAVIE